MTTHSDWTAWCDDLGEVYESGVMIELPGGRGHFVAVVEHPGERMIELSGQVGALATAQDTIDRVTANRDRRMTAVIVDEEEHVWVTALVPDLGLTAEEFRLLATEVAKEADRLEFLSTGADDY